MAVYIFPPLSLSSGPLQYTRKTGGVSSSTNVLEDLDTPANSRSLPVVIHSIDGAPINITAGDLNVNLSDRGSNPDATRIGDGTNLMGVNSNLEAKVHDADLLTRANLLAADATLLATNTLVGAVTETAPATDTASSGLNGRLQRVAQRLTSLIALLPTALGQGTMATSMKVVLPSDQSAIPVTMAAVPTGGATAALQTTGNTSLATIATNTTSIATSALQTTGNTSLSSMVTNTGAQADAVATTDTGTFSLIALVKKVAQNITAMSAKLPAALGITTSANSLSIAPASDAKFSIKPSTITTTYAENLALTTVTTITAPANAVSVLVMADDANANNIRIKQNGTASLTSGFPLQAGRDITFDGGQDLSVISDNAGSAGASVKIYFSWKIQA